MLSKWSVWLLLDISLEVLQRYPALYRESQQNPQ